MKWLGPCVSLLLQAMQWLIFYCIFTKWLQHQQTNTYSVVDHWLFASFVQYVLQNPLKIYNCLQAIIWSPTCPSNTSWCVSQPLNPINCPWHQLANCTHRKCQNNHDIHHSMYERLYPSFEWNTFHFPFYIPNFLIWKSWKIWICIFHVVYLRFSSM